MNTVDLRQVISNAAAAYGVPDQIAQAVAWRETGTRHFNQDGSVIRGSAGELGVMQLMPSTAAQYGVDPRDPQQNVEGGVHYLADLYRQFGDWSAAVAAYNWGGKHVHDAMAAGKDFPASVNAYVSAVMKRAGQPAILRAATSPLTIGLMVAAGVVVLSFVLDRA